MPAAAPLEMNAASTPINLAIYPDEERLPYLIKEKTPYPIGEKTP
jgi:hypothetical protein